MENPFFRDNLTAVNEVIPAKVNLEVEDLALLDGKSVSTIYRKYGKDGMLKGDYVHINSLWDYLSPTGKSEINRALKKRAARFGMI